MELFGPLPAVEKWIEGPAPGPDNDWGSLTEPIHSLRPVAELVRTTPGSAGLELSSTTSTILTPDSPAINIPTGVKGPLPKGLVGIILGRSSLAMQGLTIIPGVIDSDYTGEIQIMITLPTKTSQIHQGQRIAQLLLLPYHTAIGHTATQNESQDKGFGSSDMVFWVTDFSETPYEHYFCQWQVYCRTIRYRSRCFLYFWERLAQLLAHPYY